MSAVGKEESRDEDVQVITAPPFVDLEAAIEVVSDHEGAAREALAAAEVAPEFARSPLSVAPVDEGAAEAAEQTSLAAQALAEATVQAATGQPSPADEAPAEATAQAATVQPSLADEAPAEATVQPVTEQPSLAAEAPAAAAEQPSVGAEAPAAATEQPSLVAEAPAAATEQVAEPPAAATEQVAQAPAAATEQPPAQNALPDHWQVGHHHLHLQFQGLLVEGSQLSDLDEVAEAVGRFRQSVLDLRASLAAHIHGSIQKIWLEIWFCAFKNKKERPGRIVEIFHMFKDKWVHDAKDTHLILATAVLFLSEMDGLSTPWLCVQNHVARSKHKKKSAWDALCRAVQLPDREWIASMQPGAPSPEDPQPEQQQQQQQQGHRHQRELGNLREAVQLKAMPKRPYPFGPMYNAHADTAEASKPERDWKAEAEDDNWDYWADWGDWKAQWKPKDQGYKDKAEDEDDHWGDWRAQQKAKDQDDDWTERQDDNWGDWQPQPQWQPSQRPPPPEDTADTSSEDSPEPKQQRYKRIRKGHPAPEADIITSHWTPYGLLEDLERRVATGAASSGASSSACPPWRQVARPASDLPPPARETWDWPPPAREIGDWPPPARETWDLPPPPPPAVPPAPCAGLPLGPVHAAGMGPVQPARPPVPAKKPAVPVPPGCVLGADGLFRKVPPPPKGDLWIAHVVPCAYVPIEVCAMDCLATSVSVRLRAAGLLCV
eukprot:6492726-Amphidinium_carterae.11